MAVGVRLFDMTAMTVTGTPGTGTITLNAALTGFQTFSSAGVPDQAVVTYRITDTGNAWEVGRGTYTASGTTLTRGPIYSSNSNAAISATSGAVVYIVALQEDFKQMASVDWHTGLGGL